MDGQLVSEIFLSLLKDAFKFDEEAEQEDTLEATNDEKLSGLPPHHCCLASEAVTSVSILSTLSGRGSGPARQLPRWPEIMFCRPETSASAWFTTDT